MFPCYVVSEILMILWTESLKIIEFCFFFLRFTRLPGSSQSLAWKSNRSVRFWMCASKMESVNSSLTLLSRVFSGDCLWRPRQEPRDVQSAAHTWDHVQVRRDETNSHRSVPCTFLTLSPLLTPPTPTHTPPPSSTRLLSKMSLRSHSCGFNYNLKINFFGSRLRGKRFIYRGILPTYPIQ